MTTRLFAILAVSASLLLGGCLESHILLRVNKDGSGTIREKLMMNKETVREMEDMARHFRATMSEEDQDKMDFSLIDDADLEKRAAKLGEGVRLVGTERVETGRMKGYVATYAFDDISKVTVDQTPEESTPMFAVGDNEENDQSEMVHFSFTKGTPASLVITMPQDDEKLDGMPADEEQEMEFEGEQSEEDDGEMSEEARKMMEEIFKGFKISIEVEVDGDITGTNATFVEDNRITVIEMDFETLMKHPEDLKNLDRAGDMSVEEMRELIHGIPGIKMDMNEKINVSFE